MVVALLVSEAEEFAFEADVEQRFSHNPTCSRKPLSDYRR